MKITLNFIIVKHMISNSIIKLQFEDFLSKLSKRVSSSGKHFSVTDNSNN